MKLSTLVSKLKELLEREGGDIDVTFNQEWSESITSISIWEENTKSTSISKWELHPRLIELSRTDYGSDQPDIVTTIYSENDEHISK